MLPPGNGQIHCRDHANQGTVPFGPGSSRLPSASPLPSDYSPVRLCSHTCLAEPYLGYQHNQYKIGSVYRLSEPSDRTELDRKVQDWETTSGSFWVE